MASKPNGTLYVDVTGTLCSASECIETPSLPASPAATGCRLVYYEAHDLITDAMRREHNIKHWPRRWKVALIGGMNPTWEDLCPSLVG